MSTLTSEEDERKGRERGRGRKLKGEKLTPYIATAVKMLPATAAPSSGAGPSVEPTMLWCCF